MQLVKKSNVLEPGATKLAFGSQKALELVFAKTPADYAMENEETDTSIVSKDEEMRIKVDGISALLSYLFSADNGKVPSPLVVTQRVYLLVFAVRPALIEGWSLDRIAKCFDSSRQVFSKKLLKLNDKLNVRSRNQKTDTSVSIYREGTKLWHLEKAKLKRAKARKAYLAKWRADHAKEVKAYQAAYQKKRKEQRNSKKNSNKSV